MEGTPLHREQVELVYAHAREQRTAESQLYRKDLRARVLKRAKGPVSLRVGLEPLLSKDEKALLDRGKVAIGLSPWLLYRRRHRSTT